jgi:hypothetical protein
MTHLLPLFILLTIPGLSTDPFASDTTLSYESLQGIVLNGYPIAAARSLMLPPSPGIRTPYLDDPTLLIYSPPGECLAVEPAVFDDPLVGCGGNDNCIAPAMEDVADWNQVYEIRYGINLEGLYDFWWPSSSSGKLWHAIAHLQNALQQIHAMVLRDVGVSLKVQHVHVMEAAPPWQLNGDIKEVWESGVLQMNALPQIVLRLGYEIPGGQAHLRGPCDLGEGDDLLHVSRAGYSLDMPPIATGSNFRNTALGVVSQELLHHALGLSHTQCYRNPDGTPLEPCEEAACWTGPFACVPSDTISYMGYCANCDPWPPMARLRLASPFGPMIRVARYKTLAYAAECLGLPVATIPAGAWASDTDSDEIPNSFDNCPQIANNEQGDWDTDGKGDACDWCCVGPSTNGVAWPLVLPLAFILWKKR